MTQSMIKAKNIGLAKKKFLRKNPSEKVYDVTRTFASHNKTKPNERIYRVTGVIKGLRRRK